MERRTYHDSCLSLLFTFVQSLEKNILNKCGIRLKKCSAGYLTSKWNARVRHWVGLGKDVGVNSSAGEGGSPL